MVDPPERWQQDPCGRFADAANEVRKRKRFIRWMIALGLVAPSIVIGWILYNVKPPGRTPILAEKPNMPVAEIPIRPIPDLNVGPEKPPLRKKGPRINAKAPVAPELNHLATIAFKTELQSPIVFVEFHPDGTCFCAGDGATLTVWDNGEQRKQKWHHLVGDRIYDAVFLPKRKEMIVASEVNNLGVLKKYDAETGTELEALPIHGSTKPKLIVSPNERWLVIQEYMKSAFRVVQLDKPGRAMILPEHKRPVVAVAFTENEDFLYSYGADKKLVKWNLASGKVATSRTAIEQPAWQLAHLNASHGKILGCNGRRLTCWNWKTEKEEFNCELKTSGFVHAMTADPEFRYGFIGLQKPDKKMAYGVHVIDLQSGKWVGAIGPHRHAVKSISMSRDGRFLLTTGGFDKTLILWRLEER